MIVVDTNVVAYLLLEGEQTTACRSVFRKDPAWCAPVLWRSEFRNVLTMHMRHANLSLEGALSRMSEADRLFASRDYHVSSDLVLALTSEVAFSAYDAEFVCLARELGTPLLTTDRKLQSSFSDLAISPEDFAST